MKPLFSSIMGITIVAAGVVGLSMLSTRLQPVTVAIHSPPSDSGSETLGDIEFQTVYSATSETDSPRDNENAETGDKPPPAAGLPGERGNNLTRSDDRRSWAPAKRERNKKIGFEKKLDIQISPRNVVIGFTKTIVDVTDGELTQTNIDDVLVGIDRAVLAWGEPPVHFYWVPRADFILHPGGEANCVRLRRLLKDEFGVESTVRFAADLQDDSEPEPPTDFRDE